MPVDAIAAGDAASVIDFAEAYARITKDSIAGPTGQRMVLEPWQRHVIERIYARDPQTGRRRHRRAMVGTARKNGKSGFAAILALYGLLVEGEGSEVYSCAADRDQAKLIFTAAKRMVEMDPDLKAEVTLYRDALEHKATGSIYRALSSEAFTKEGLSPSTVIYDELHAAPDRELYDVMSLAMGARLDPLMVIVTTAGVRVDRFGQPTIAHQLYDLGKRIATGEVRDSTYYMAWWEPTDPNSPPDDEQGWREANPSLGTILDPADMRSALPPATPENEYRTKRRNQWVAASTSWLPFGAWDACADPARVVRPDEPIVVSFDGSWTNDSTGIAGATVGQSPHLFTVELWEPHLTGDHIEEQLVEDAMERLMASRKVTAIVMDPAQWRAQATRWRDRGWPVIEYPNTLPRTVPAIREFYAAVVESAEAVKNGHPEKRRVTHDGDPRMARHIANATIKEDSRGQRIVKVARGQKIDLAICAFMAHDQARIQPEKPKEPWVRWA